VEERDNATVLSTRHRVDAERVLGRRIVAERESARRAAADGGAVNGAVVAGKLGRDLIRLRTLAGDVVDNAATELRNRERRLGDDRARPR
jgi:hypothetical protein